MSDLRQHLRSRRRALSNREQQRHAFFSTMRFLSWFRGLQTKRVAVFLSQDGELDTRRLIKYLWQRRIAVFLPVVEADGVLSFAPYHITTSLRPNRFGILEPSKLEPRLSITQMSLLLMPLVGFDAQGNRLGMGGGFYDKTLAACRRPCAHQPKLVGWAHQCQQVQAFPVQPWDVPLEHLITERQHWRFSRAFVRV